MARDNKNNGKSQDAGANLNLPALLASIGQAVSPEGSWQEQLGGTAKGMAEDEQSRQFLSGLLGGNMPEIKGQIGLDPNTVLEGVKTKAAITPEPEEPMEEVDTPFGTQYVPQDEAPDFRRKVWGEKASLGGTQREQFEWMMQQDKETQDAFMDFIEQNRGPSFEETLAEFLAKQEASQRQRHRLEGELELGTPEHLNKIKKDVDQSKISKFRSDNIKEGRSMSHEAAEEIYAIEKAAREMESRNKDYNRVVFRKNGERGPGFYGVTKDGKTRFIKKYKSRF